MESSKIEWTHHTFNPWRGCTKVSPGCANCYADALSKRNPGTLGVWGPHGTRVVASEAQWRLPLKWDRQAKQANERRRVFCASLADVFEGRDTMPREAWERIEAVRVRLYHLIQETPNLDWLLLTKRPQNVKAMLGSPDVPRTWAEMPRNVWLGVSVEDEERKSRIDELRRIHAAVRFLSVEPLLEDLGRLDLTRIHWVIIGGESGGMESSRPFHLEWARSIVRQCRGGERPGIRQTDGVNACSRLLSRRQRFQR